MAYITKRVYTVALCEQGEGIPGISTEEVSLYDILTPHHDSAEFIFSLQDDIDPVLDLEKGECMYFQPNRDNKASKAIIVRTE